MDEKTVHKEDGKGVDLQRLLGVLMRKAWVIGLISILCAVAVLLGTVFLITPEYTAAAMFYVNNNSLSVGDASFSISSGDLTTSRNLVDSYIVILNTRETLNDVRDYAGSSRSFEDLTKMISAGSVNETEIFEVAVTSTDPVEAERLANAIAYILPKRIGTIIDGTSAKVVDAAIVPVKPSSPNYTMNTILGFLLGFILSVGIIVVREILDVTVRLEEDIKQVCKYPILASVPDMENPGKNGSYYGYGRKTGKYASDKPGGKHALMGPDVSFAASEAYKLLRTKLQFSFSDENDSRVIGLSSALCGEGKSLTAVNLAFTLSQLNKKVLLVDCDMRRPTLADKVKVLKEPGLSSYLTRQSQLEDVIQICCLKPGESIFHVISAGQNPPNPIELLSSVRMERAIEAMRKAYDYVILDLPPVGEVSDAMAVAKQTDGMLLVVRQNLCDRGILDDTVRQFEFIGSRILGVVFNGTGESTGKYGSGSYKRYYRKEYEKSHRKAVKDSNRKKAE